jgi:hypothetical protein
MQESPEIPETSNRLSAECPRHEKASLESQAVPSSSLVDEKGCLQDETTDEPLTPMSESKAGEPSSAEAVDSSTLLFARSNGDSTSR